MIECVHIGNKKYVNSQENMGMLDGYRIDKNK